MIVSESDVESAIFTKSVWVLSDKNASALVFEKFIPAVLFILMFN